MKHKEESDVREPFGGLRYGLFGFNEEFIERDAVRASAVPALRFAEMFEEDVDLERRVEARSFAVAGTVESFAEVFVAGDPAGELRRGRFGQYVGEIQLGQFLMAVNSFFMHNRIDV